jgi:hypothetical protein
MEGVGRGRRRAARPCGRRRIRQHGARRLPAAHWDAFGQEAALRRRRLIDLERGRAAAAGAAPHRQRVLHACSASRRSTAARRPRAPGTRADTARPVARGHRGRARGGGPARRPPALIGLSARTAKAATMSPRCWPAERGTGLLAVATDLLPPARRKATRSPS